MESERLEPLETLEKDYYLGERNGWYSDGEQRDSESSDDELREQLRELAGMRCKSRKEKRKTRKDAKKDKFELDMDNELSGNFVAHASKIFSSSSKENSGNLERITRVNNKYLVDDENEMDAESSGSKTVKDETIANSDVASSTNRDSSNKPAKSVTFEKQPDKHMNVEQSSRSSFDDDNNLLRKASNKVANAAKMKQLNSTIRMKMKTMNDGRSTLMPCMYVIINEDCQRHELYHNQYRYYFPMFFSEFEKIRSLKVVQRFMKKYGIKPNAVVDPANVTTLPKEDLFHPVLCSICATNVGVYDYEEHLITLKYFSRDIQVVFLLRSEQIIYQEPRANNVKNNAKQKFKYIPSRLSITITEFYYCTRKFLAWNLSWEGSCLKSNGVGDTWWRIRYFWAIFLPNGMFVIYVTIFYSIRRKHRFATDINRSQSGTIVTKTNDYEWSMLIQAAWSYGVMEIGIITFNFLPSFLVQIFGERIDIPSRIFVNSYAIAFCATLPTVYFIYAGGARNIVKQYLCHLFHLVAANSKNKVILIGVRTGAVR
ncbi:hypothetical protein DINM_007220 [Dirofilaria immitis]|nr:hypothetical protein [Dirofilaria immitis]